MSVVFVGSSQLEIEIFVFVLQIAPVMKEKTFQRVLWDVARCGLKEGRKGATEDSLVDIPTTGRLKHPV